MNCCCNSMWRKNNKSNDIQNLLEFRAPSLNARCSLMVTRAKFSAWKRNIWISSMSAQYLVYLNDGNFVDVIGMSHCSQMKLDSQFVSVMRYGFDAENLLDIGFWLLSLNQVLEVYFRKWCHNQECTK